MEFSKLRFNFQSVARGTSRLCESAGRAAQMAAAAVVFASVLAGCRLDMHVQPKYVTEQPTGFFPDGRSERPLVPGTVPRGHLQIDSLLYTGMENGVESNAFPFPITRADLERGRERFNIYCTPCHDYTGNGNGMIVQRGLSHPPSYNIQRLREAPVGHFVNVMTNGFGRMYSYATRISPADRWRIAAYIRALQLSQYAPVKDVPAADMSKLNQPQVVPPPLGYLPGGDAGEPAGVRVGQKKQ
jgi:cytochrome c553